MWKEKLEQAEKRKLQVTKELQVSFQLAKLTEDLQRDMPVNMQM